MCQCSSVLWKVKIARFKIKYLADEIFNSGVEEAVWFLLMLIVKCEKRKIN